MPCFFSFSISIAALLLCTSAAGEETSQQKNSADTSPQPNMVFLCKDSGQEIYTNTKINKHCKSFNLSPIQSRQKPSTSPTTATTSSLDQATFPKVTEEKQKERDLDRRKILEEELATENKKLAEAKRELNKQEQKVLAEERNYKTITERLQPNKELVAQHERNIQALQKELSNMK